MRLKLPYAREWSSARTARRPFLVWEAGQAWIVQSRACFRSSASLPDRVR